VNFLDGYINRAMPHVRTAGITARAYGERICAQLDLILQELQTEEFAEFHPRQSFTLTAGTSQDMVQIPTGEMWELETLTCDGTGATVRISEGADTAPRYASTFAAPDTKPGLGLIFGGGTAPIIQTSGANAVVSVQFRRLRQQPATASRAPGLIEAPDVWNGQPYGERDADGRHATPVGAGVNVVGARRGDGLTVDPYGRL
jgi:hypothetical protein